MDYGLQISASGAMTAMYRQDVLSNNLANASTVGFKPDVPTTYQRDAVRREDGLPFLPSNAMLEKLGAGLMLNPNRMIFGQGALERTGGPLDVAIQGNGFFVVRDDTGTTDRARLTRDGRFLRDTHGVLVTAAGGKPVLDVNNQPITLAGSGKVTIGTDGTVQQDGRAVARIQLVDVPQPEQLSKLGQSMFRPPPGGVPEHKRADGTLRQGFVEASSVDEITTMMQITGASRDVEANTVMIQQADRLMDRAINLLGRVT